MRARIRSIKPEILIDDQLWDAEQKSALPLYRAFTGLWMYADKEGRFEWNARKLGAVVLPYWRGDFDDVLTVLATHEYIVRYEVEGRAYGYVRTFKRHQVVNHREADSALPAPVSTHPPGTPGNDGGGAAARPSNGQGVPSTGPGFSSGERKGREGEREGNGAAAARLPAHVPAHTRPDAPPRAYVKPPDEPPGPALPAVLAPSPAAAEISLQEFSADEMAHEFSNVFYALRGSRPNLRGHVNGLHGEVCEVAKARGVQPRAILTLAAKRWCEGELNDREKKHPYACFAAAFGSVIGAVNGQSASERDELFAKSNDALKRGDLPAYEAAEREIEAYMEGQGQHAAAS